jgi:signal peptidase I
MQSAVRTPSIVRRSHRGVNKRALALRELYVAPAMRDQRSGAWPRIAPGHYFFMGDDRAHSCDSRTWGTVPRSNLIGPVVATYWPPDRIAWH